MCQSPADLATETDVTNHPSACEGGMQPWLGTATYYDVSPHTKDLPTCDVRQIPMPSVTSVASTGIDIFWAAALLKLFSIDKIAQAIVGLRLKYKGRVGMTSVDLIREVEIYKRACVYFYDPRDKCMLNTLSLIRYLARRGCFPKWYIGVQIRPFTAHCWVEDEDFIYGDSLGNCREFRPILVV